MFFAKNTLAEYKLKRLPRQKRSSLLHIAVTLFYSNLKSSGKVNVSTYSPHGDES